MEYWNGGILESWFIDKDTIFLDFVSLKLRPKIHCCIVLSGLPAQMAGGNTLFPTIPKFHHSIQLINLD